MSKCEIIYAILCFAILLLFSVFLRDLAADPFYGENIQQVNVCADALNMVEASMSDEARSEIPSEVWEQAYTMCL